MSTPIYPSREGYVQHKSSTGHISSKPKEQDNTPDPSETSTSTPTIRNVDYSVNTIESNKSEMKNLVLDGPNKNVSSENGWVCDVCETAEFSTYEEAVAHEKKCHEEQLKKRTQVMPSWSTRSEVTRKTDTAEFSTYEEAVAHKKKCHGEQLKKLTQVTPSSNSGVTRETAQNTITDEAVTNRAMVQHHTQYGTGHGQDQHVQGNFPRNQCVLTQPSTPAVYQQRLLQNTGYQKGPYMYASTQYTRGQTQPLGNQMTLGTCNIYNEMSPLLDAFIPSSLGWCCKHCLTVPLRFRAPGALSQTRERPSVQFVEGHLSICSGNRYYSPSEQSVRSHSLMPTQQASNCEIHQQPGIPQQHAYTMTQQQPQYLQRSYAGEQSRYQGYRQMERMQYDPKTNARPDDLKSSKTSPPLVTPNTYSTPSDLYRIVEPNTPLLIEDKKLITDYFFFLMRQLEVCNFEESDRKARKRENIKLGFGGLKCRHCTHKTGTSGRKFFWSNVDRLANSFAEIPAHIMVRSSLFLL